MLSVSLSAKWIKKLERGDQDLSCQILRSIYVTDFFKNQLEQFWKGLHASKHYVRWDLLIAAPFL
jgi:hypothetical protein